jgi:hypothetical protein
MNSKEKAETLKASFYTPQNPAKMHFVMREFVDLWDYISELEERIQQLESLLNDEDPSYTFLAGGTASPPNHDESGHLPPFFEATPESQPTVATSTRKTSLEDKGEAPASPSVLNNMEGGK